MSPVRCRAETDSFSWLVLTEAPAPNRAVAREEVNATAGDDRRAALVPRQRLWIVLPTHYGNVSPWVERRRKRRRRVPETGKFGDGVSARPFLANHRSPLCVLQPIRRTIGLCNDVERAVKRRTGAEGGRSTRRKRAARTPPTIRGSPAIVRGNRGSVCVWVCRVFKGNGVVDDLKTASLAIRLANGLFIPAHGNLALFPCRDPPLVCPSHPTSQSSTQELMRTFF